MAVLEAIVHEDPDWLGVTLESTARVRTDAGLRELVEAKEADARSRRPERFERLREQGVRDDVSIESVALLLGLVANGLALHRAGGGTAPDVDELVLLVETGVAPREVSRTHAQRKTPVRARPT